jgi:hypothetical protein
MTCTKCGKPTQPSDREWVRIGTWNTMDDQNADIRSTQVDAMVCWDCRCKIVNFLFDKSSLTMAELRS